MLRSSSRGLYVVALGFCLLSTGIRIADAADASPPAALPSPAAPNSAFVPTSPLSAPNFGITRGDVALEKGPVVNPNDISQSNSAILRAIGDGSKWLDRNGLRIDLTFYDNPIWNPASGIVANQTSNLGMFGFNADLDLQKAIGLPGATIHGAYTVYGLRGQSKMLQDMGSLIASIPYVKYHKPLVLNELTYEQKIGWADAEAGRTNPFRYFWQSQYCDNVFACGPTTVYGNAPELPLRYATWGGILQLNLAPALSLRFGAFQDQAYNLNTDGFDFRADDKTTGVMTVGQLMYTTNYKNTRYPSYAVIGMFGDTTEHNNPYYSALGRSIQLHPKDPVQPENGPVAFFAEGRQAVWRSSAPVPPGADPKNFALQAGVFQVLNAHQNFASEAWLGGQWTGFIPGRPFDHFGAKIHYINISSEYAQSETLGRALVGNNRAQPRNEYVFEPSYSLQVAPGILFQPDVQYIVNGDSDFVASPKKGTRDGFVVSAFLIISLDRILGLPAPR